MKHLKSILIGCAIAFTSISANAQLLINEYSCANLTAFNDVFGKSEDWFEVINNGKDSVDVSGYFVSDNPKTPKKWTLPAKTKIAPQGILLFIASGRNLVSKGQFHTNFKFTQTKSNPETIVFSNTKGVTVDQIKIQKTKDDQSRGRLTGNTSKWVIYTQSSAGEPNPTDNYFQNTAEKPTFDQTAGFYKAAIVVKIVNNEPNSTIRYTTNGQVPTLKSAVYKDSALLLKKTTVLQAIAFPNDSLSKTQPSFIGFETYFVGTKHTMSVISIATDSLEILANGNKDLKPLGSFEYFNKDGVRKSSCYGEFNSHGQDSWANDQRSLDFVARDEAGYDYAVKEKIFKYTDRDKFQNLILRAAGDDNYPAAFNPENAGSAHLRDAYIQNMAKRDGLNLDVREGAKTIVYINGKYWGVYDIRERPDDHDYTDYNYNQGKYDIQYIKTWGETWAEYGEDKALTDWASFYNFASKQNMKIQSNFDKVTAQLDVTSLVDYVIINSVTVCSDWLNYNTGWWRGLNPDGGHKKWGYTLWDNDATFAFYINYTEIKDTSAKATPCQVESLTSETDPEGHIKLLQNLRKNPEFNQYYISRYIDLMNTTFNAKNMLSTLDSAYLSIKPEMPEHIKRWGGTMAGWEKNVARLRNFIERRCKLLDAGMKTCYKLDGPYELTFDINPANVGHIKVNSLDIKQVPYKGRYFGGIDIKMEAFNDSSKVYMFQKWVNNKNTFVKGDTLSARLKITSADTIVARFVKLITAVKDLSDDADGLELKAYPTIFNETLTVEFNVTEQSPISIQLYTSDGRLAFQLAEKGTALLPGHYNMQLQIPGGSLAEGLYILKFESKNAQEVKKLILKR